MKDIFIGKKLQINCLDLGFVRLIDSMPRLIPDKEDGMDYTIAEAARCSYKRKTKTKTNDEELIRYLMRHNHTSPFEMIEFKFHCKMPIYIAREWIRHRTASVSELSGRYSKMPEEVNIPDNFRKQSQVNTQGSEGSMDKCENESTRNLMQFHAQDTFELYNKFLDEGMAREQARIVLPLSTYTEWYWKIDLHNLLHFLDLRCDNNAQKEIQIYANAILELIKPMVPWTIEAWEDYSPYREGMLLTKFEIQSLKEIIKNKSQYYDISIDNKIERKEWEEKVKKLGIFKYMISI
jgi:thymidylate synthase (FAD)